MESTNGIGAFIDLVNKYRLPHQVEEDKANAHVNRTYDRHYPGGLQQYLLNFEEAFARLDKIEHEKAKKEDRAVQVVPQTARLTQLRNTQRACGRLSKRLDASRCTQR